MTNLIASSSVNINAPVSNVWNALIDPEMIKQYLFGTTAKSDWKEGSTITYSGEWQGKPYEDHGKIVKIVPNDILVSTYWSAAFGPETPENHKNVTYKVDSISENETKLTITQDNNTSEEDLKHSETNWNMVLTSIKNLLEKN